MRKRFLGRPGGLDACGKLRFHVDACLGQDRRDRGATVRSAEMAERMTVDQTVAQAPGREDER